MAEANLPASNDEFDKDFKPDERLFHYTSSPGLYGILESGCLWATHFKFLNDSNEFFAARKSLIEFVELEIRKKIAALKVSGSITLKEGITIKELSAHEATTIVNSMYTVTLNHSVPFIFSLYVSDPESDDFRRGRLLHWATYGRDGGYALEINPHKLAALFRGKTENLLSQKAIYVGASPPLELTNEYALIGKVAQEMIVGILNDSLGGIDIERSAQAFMKVASVIKDNFFENEREARVVLLRLKTVMGEYVPPSVFIRHHQSRAVPYIKLFEKRLLGEQSPIESIIIGPHPDRDRREEALRLFLDARGLATIELFQSDVPYLSV